MSVLSEEQIREFRSRGVLVVPSVLTDEEVQQARQGFHEDLLSRGCAVGDIANKDGVALAALKRLSSTNGAGGILDVFYGAWKLRLNEHPLIFRAVSELWAATYAAGDADFAHPFGAFAADRGYMYVDRVCFRLPDALSQAEKRPVQRSLTPHLDCCPHEMFAGRKWRPIQCFVALTDTLLPDEGGFEACPGHHVGFDEWAQRRAPSLSAPRPAAQSGVKSFRGVPCVGEFSPIRPQEDRDVIERMEHVSCRAGDLVLWDVRIPHANASHNHKDTPREVVYLGFLPDVPINREYAKKQLELYNNGDVPTDQWHKCSSKQDNSHNFSELGRKLMSIDGWE